MANAEGGQQPGSFEQIVADWKGRQGDFGEEVNRRVEILLQLAQSWRSRVAEIDMRHPLTTDPVARRMLAGMRPVNLETDGLCTGSPVDQSPPQN